MFIITDSDFACDNFLSVIEEIEGFLITGFRVSIAMADALDKVIGEWQLRCPSGKIAICRAVEGFFDEDDEEGVMLAFAVDDYVLDDDGLFINGDPCSLVSLPAGVMSLEEDYYRLTQFWANYDGDDSVTIILYEHPEESVIAGEEFEAELYKLKVQLFEEVLTDLDIDFDYVAFDRNRYERFLQSNNLIDSREARAVWANDQ